MQHLLHYFFPIFIFLTFLTNPLHAQGSLDGSDLSTRRGIDRTENLPSLASLHPEPAVIDKPLPRPCPLRSEKLYAFAGVAALSFLLAIALWRQRRKNKQLIQQSQMFNDLIASLKHDLAKKDHDMAFIVHEIRNPLSAIIGLSDHLLQSKHSYASKIHLERIHSAGIILLDFINQILDFTKYSHTHIKLDEVEFNINDVFENLAGLTYLKSQEKKLDIIFDVDWNVPTTLVGDPVRLKQILINLVMNAIKFTDSGEVSIIGRQIAQHNRVVTLQFEVHDTGIGIKQEHLDKLFQPFSQGDTTIQAKYGGTGLGLVITKILIEAMKGSISVKSEYGLGTTFTFTIDLLLPEHTEQRKYRLPSQQLMNCDVLIIDHNTTSATALQKKLEYFHMNITNATSWAAGQNLITLRQNPFTLVCINLHVFDNDDITAMLRYLSGLNSQVIIITDDVDALETYQGEFADHFKFLERPYNHQKIYELLASIDRQTPFITRSQDLSDLAKAKLREFVGHKVLLAEDNTINQSLIKAMLDNTGIELIIASNGEEAYRLLTQNHNISLILMDINMPIMDGYETTRRVRTELGLTIPVIGLSAHDDALLKKQCEEIGMTTYLVKPIKSVQFYELLNYYFALDDTKPMTTVVLDENYGIKFFGSKEHYTTVLQNFRQTYRDVAATLEHHAQHQHYEEMKWVVHDFKGLAGSLGALALCDSAKRLENHIITHQEESFETDISMIRTQMMTFILATEL